MSLISSNFLLFVLVLLILYYALPQKARPYILLAGSVAFYLAADWRYFPFLLFSAISCYVAGRVLEKKRSCHILTAVIVLNAGLLLFVKFSPYFAGLASRWLSVKVPSFFTNVIVPLGISFYTLQLIGYCVDVYRGKIKAEHHFFRFLLFAMFFPSILQGPISRYDQLSHQLFDANKAGNLYKNLTFGSQLMLFGFFQKLVIADRVAMLVDPVFNSPEKYGAVTLTAAVLGYALQIYCDFSGCVDICRGCAEMFGIELIPNFRQPYFASSIQDFWRRWHISLSSWLKDYIYIPLGGNRKGIFRKYCNLVIVFLVSGIWHGVGFHFIIWGLLHAIYQIIGALTLPAKTKFCKKLHLDRDAGWFLLIRRGITFLLVTVAWIFFRTDLFGAFCILGRIITMKPGVLSLGQMELLDLVVLCAAILLLCILNYYRNRQISMRETFSRLPIPARWAIYLAGLFAVLIFGIYGPGYSSSGFIYMNF